MRQTMIHRTTAERAERILQDGLRVGMPLNLTDCGTWAHVWYGTNPVFLAMPDAPFLDAVPDDGADIAVDARGLALVADLPSLCDTGGHVDEGVMWWKEGREPAGLLPYLDADGGIEIEYLVDPTADACRAAIGVTLTAACLSGIAAHRLERRHRSGVAARSPL